MVGWGGGGEEEGVVVVGRNEGEERTPTLPVTTQGLYLSRLHTERSEKKTTTDATKRQPPPQPPSPSPPPPPVTSFRREQNVRRTRQRQYRTQPPEEEEEEGVVVWEVGRDMFLLLIYFRSVGWGGVLGEGRLWLIHPSSHLTCSGGVICSA